VNYVSFHLEMKSRWFKISAIFGVLCFALSVFSIEYKIEQTTITIPWSIVFPVIVSMAYGMQGALVSSLFGAMWMPAILWPENGWALISSFMAYALFYLVIGYVSKKTRDEGLKFRVIFFSIVVFIVLHLFLYLIVFKCLLRISGEQITYATIMVILIKNAISFLFIIIFCDAIIRTNGLRKLLQMSVNGYRRNNLNLIIYSFFTTVSIWLAFYLLNHFLIQSDGRTEYLGLLFMLLVFSSALISRWLIFASERQIKAERKLIDFKNQLEKLVQSRTSELQKSIEDLKETKATLFQAEKMASLGILTAGVAHEVNNPLNFLKGAYEGLSKYFRKYGSHENKKTDLLLSSLQVGVDRIIAIVQGLNQFSRSNEDMDESCELHSILDNCLAILNSKTKYKIEVKKNYTQQPVVVKGNVGKMHQVFLNVLTNAIHSIEDTGEITAVTAIRNKSVIVEISDTGTGIDKAILQRITDPFFTTKPSGEGTGLGLSITYSIISEHKGTIGFESELGIGTKVRISLPINLENE